jgi:hypothetical protein
MSVRFRVQKRTLLVFILSEINPDQALRSLMVIIDEKYLGN